MGKLRNNQKGFTAVEVLLVILILVVVGAVGYMVYHNDHKTKTVSTTNTSSNKPTTSTKSSTSTTTATTDPTANWTPYTNSSGGYSLKYPTTWSTAANASSCSSSLLLLGANSSSVGSCNTNNFGQITVTWQPVKAPCGLDSSDWTVNSTQSVTVSGVSGTETTGTSKVATTVPAGTSTVQYCFITKGNMYVADYSELSSYPNVLSDFNLMVTKTLTFN